MRANKIYFQKHYKRAFGNPDIAIPRKKKAVFIDGDFWHGWKFSTIKARLPQTYWVEKIETNIKRDRRNRLKLKKDGWEVLRIWEHQLKKNEAATLQLILDFLTDKQRNLLKP